jgi:hypothetical protein
MKSHLTVRRMAVSEVDAVLSLDDWPPSARLTHACVKSALVNNDAECVVAVRHGQVVGFFILWRIPVGVELTRICVSKGPDARKILRALLRVLLYCLRPNRGNEVFATVPETSHALRRALSWYGFERGSRLIDYYTAERLAGRQYTLPPLTIEV